MIQIFFLTWIDYSRSSKNLKINRSIWQNDNNKWYCIHHKHSKYGIINLMYFIRKEIISYTLLIPCYIGVTFYMKNNCLKKIKIRKKICYYLFMKNVMFFYFYIVNKKAQTKKCSDKILNLLHRKYTQLVNLYIIHWRIFELLKTKSQKKFIGDVIFTPVPSVVNPWTNFLPKIHMNLNLVSF